MIPFLLTCVTFLSVSLVYVVLKHAEALQELKRPRRLEYVGPEQRGRLYTKGSVYKHAQVDGDPKSIDVVIYVESLSAMVTQRMRVVDAVQWMVGQPISVYVERREE